MFFECVMSAYMALCADTGIVDKCRSDFINCVARELVTRDDVSRSTQEDTFNMCEKEVFKKKLDKSKYTCN